MAKTSSQRVLVGYIKVRVIRLCKVAKNIESTCFGYIMCYIKWRKTSSQRVLVGYIKWRKHRVNVVW